MFPYFQHPFAFKSDCGTARDSGEAVPNDMGNAAGQEDAVEDDPVISFERTLGFAGGLHIVHGIAKGMMMAMAAFKEIHKQLDVTTQVLHHRWTRERFVASCLTSPTTVGWKPMFDTFDATIVGWRWGSVCECTRELLKRENILRNCWRREKVLSATVQASNE